MTKYFLTLIIFFYSCQQNSVTMDNSTIIPKPVKITSNEGIFNLSSHTKIEYDSCFYNEALFLEKVIPIKTGGTKNSITLKKNDLLAKEEYYLKIKKEGITLEASGPEGQMHAIQSLRQLIPIDYKDRLLNIPIKCVEIHDYPRFKWRGLLLDCCRHFIEKDFIKRYIDLLAYHKMNTLHWHLTEDQGWRIAIDKYPELTNIGAWRKNKDGDIYGGFYSKEDIKEIVKYAEARHVKIVPEIELPGHCVAAIASYPHLSCTGDSIDVENDWGVFKDIYCAGNDSVFTFLEDVLSEVIDLFPSEYIHIGGDEAPKFRWEECKKCQARMIKENIKDEHELQSYFIKRIAKFLEKKGKKIIGWDEILEGGVAPTATIQSWRGTEGAILAAKDNHNAIMSPTSHCYFDYDLNAIDLEKVYSFEPIPKELEGDEKKYIIGGECNMWTERAPQEKIDSKIFPRILAMSEVLWSTKEKNYEEFYKRVQNHYPKLDEMNVAYGYEKTPIEYSVLFNKDQFNISIEKGNRSMDLLYKIDNHSWKEYSQPFSVSNSCTITTKEKNPRQKKAASRSLNINFHKGIGKKITYVTGYNKNYTGSGKQTLINGISGSADNFRDGQWQGFFGEDVEIIIDLQEDTTFSELTASFFQYHLSWIILPRSIEYLISNDGKQFTSIYKKKDLASPMKEGKFKEHFTYKNQHTAKYIKLKAKNYGGLPKEHPAAGSKSWLFIDEFIIQ